MEIIKFANNEDEVIEKAVAILQRGNLLIYPTETCYGIGGDATNVDAIKKVLAYKSKRSDKPLSVAVCNKEMAQEYVHLNKTADNLYHLFLPGPVTVVSQGKNNVAPGVQSPHGTLGIRIPKYNLVLKIIQKFGKPITATSANASYKKTPYEINDIIENISQKQKDLVGLAIDAGKLPQRKPSVVVDTTLEDLHIVRAGQLNIDKYKKITIDTEEDTKKFAKEIHDKIKNLVGKKLIVFLLQGDLGTGKTFFTRTLANYLGIKDHVSSPTFILCREHAIPKTKGFMFHIDTYRMFNVEEMHDLGCEKMFSAPNIVMIEWADKVKEYIELHLKKAVVVDIYLKHTDVNKREITFAISE